MNVVYDTCVKLVIEGAQQKIGDAHQNLIHSFSFSFSFFNFYSAVRLGFIQGFDSRCSDGQTPPRTPGVAVGIRFSLFPFTLSLPFTFAFFGLRLSLQLQVAISLSFQILLLLFLSFSQRQLPQRQPCSSPKKVICLPLYGILFIYFYVLGTYFIC